MRVAPKKLPCSATRKSIARRIHRQLRPEHAERKFLARRGRVQALPPEARRVLCGDLDFGLCRGSAGVAPGPAASRVAPSKASASQLHGTRKAASAMTIDAHRASLYAIRSGAASAEVAPCDSRARPAHDNPGGARYIEAHRRKWVACRIGSSGRPFVVRQSRR